MRLTLLAGGRRADVVLSIGRPGATVNDLVTVATGACGPFAQEGIEPESLVAVVDDRAMAGETELAACGLLDGTVIRFVPRLRALSAEKLGSPETAPGMVDGWTDHRRDAPPDGGRAGAGVWLHVSGGLHAGQTRFLGPGAHPLGRGVADPRDLNDPTVSRCHARLYVGTDGDVTVEDAASTNGVHVAAPGEDGRVIEGRHEVALDSQIQLGATILNLRGAPGQHRSQTAGPPSADGRVVWHRGPRRAALPPPDPVTVPAAEPPPAPPIQFGWTSLLIPLVIGGVMAVIFSPIMAAFVLFSPVMVLTNWWEDHRRAGRDRRSRADRTAAAIAGFTASLAQARCLERSRRSHLYPDPARSASVALGWCPSLWERRRDDPAAFFLHLGIGQVPWSPPMIEPAAPAPGAPEVAAAFAQISGCPVVVDVGPGRVVGLAGAIEVVSAVARSLIVQASTWHGPADLRIGLVGEAEQMDEWDWLKWLPHYRGLLRTDASDGWTDALDPRIPTLVLITKLPPPAERASLVRSLLQGGAASVIVLAPRVDDLPAGATVVAAQGDAGAGVLQTADDQVLLLSGMDYDQAEEVARSLAPLVDPEADDPGIGLPSSLTLTELLPTAAAGRAVLEAWRTAGSDPTPTATIGRGPQGPLTIDLERDGPHALIGGTTGSGKSELLRAAVVSLALACSPDHLNFVLIDYKGGSAFAECARLPHTVGLVTDLDDHLAERALRCLEAELKQRERILREAGATDLKEYRRQAEDHQRQGRIPLPLPRLVVIVDEFATLAAELPDFLDALVGIAQRGRSLGVHLVLATQRPSGAVNDNIRANTNIRIALRMQDAADSTDVVGVPDAAGIERRSPGRAFLRLGPSELVPFQCARVSTRCTSASKSEGIIAAPFTLAGPEPPVRSVAPSEGSEPCDSATDLGRFVEVACEAFSLSEGAAPRRPWPPPLPTCLDVGQIKDETTRSGGGVILGLVDDPDTQRQQPYTWAPRDGNLLFVGACGMGTTSALATAALALAEKWSPDELHLYALDFGNQQLTPLARLPHCAGVIGPRDLELQERLIRRLRSELDGRRQASVEARLPGPVIVLIIDNYGALHHAWDDVGRLSWRDDLARLMADGPGLGIATVLSADRPGSVPASISSAVTHKLVFRLADPYDLAAYGLSPNRGPAAIPGRSIEVATGQAVQVIRPGPAGIEDLAHAVRACCTRHAAKATMGPAPGRTGPAVLHRIPKLVTVDDAGPARLDDNGDLVVPIGIAGSHLGPAFFRLGESDHLLIAGPPRSGKSSVLAHVARAAVEAGAAVSVVVPRRSPLRDTAGVTVATDIDDLTPVVDDLLSHDGRQLLVIDDAELVDDLTGDIRRLLRVRHPWLHVVAAGRNDALRTAFAHWTQEVRRSRQGLALLPQPDLDGDIWQVELPRRSSAPWVVGRGYLVHGGEVELVQTAQVAAA